MKSAINKTDLSIADELATACLTTALSLDLQRSHLPAPPDELIVSGGGARNPVLMREIANSLRATIITTAELGIPTDAREAIAFALLGAATLDGVPSNIPSVTGAKRRVVLGSITPFP
jgi:anhydro-N-acetylmuramic acid kinase